MRSTEFDIIIVNYKSTNYLIDCLKSVYESLGGLSANIFVQDNFSGDADRIQRVHPDVHLTKNVENQGFSTAINKALKNGASPYIILLNPDSKVYPGFFEKVIRFMKNNPGVGICGPKILNADLTIQGSARAFPTPLTGFFGRNSLLTKWFPNNWITRKSILTNKIRGKNPVDVDWVSGACMVVKRSAVDDVGFMDERFFMYWEDVDWCRRMWESGWRVVYYPGAKIIHYVGGSSNKRPVRSLYEFHKSCYKYLVKYSSVPLSVLKPIALVGLTIRFIFSVLVLFFSSTISSWKKDVQIKEDAPPKILFLITEDWYFWSHRLPLARAAQRAGFKVTIATRVSAFKEKIEREGFKLIPIKLERKSKNIFKEMIDFLEILKIYRREQPTLVHHVAMKPVLYGSWAARMMNVPAIVNAIAGLGFVFLAKGRKSILIKKMVGLAYRSAFSRDNTIGIFQNPQDLNLFTQSRIVKPEKTILIRGAGVDITRYGYAEEKNNGVPLVVLASRMLWDKGIGEFVKAARMVNQNGKQSRFVLVGDPDPENPMTITEKVLKKWHASGVVEWWGHREDIPDIFSNSNIVALPSYREGLPKVLLEAASCGRALLATDVPGCREIVRHNENGLLVPPYNSEKLAEALMVLIHDNALRMKMGKTGREIVEREFSEDIVAKETMSIYTMFSASLEN